MRYIGTDGWNSFWHLLFGVIASKINIVLPLFIIYQLLDIHNKNTMVDILEFFIGFVLGLLLFSIKLKNT
jgi:uncharacterized transporter YbjL